MPFQEGVPWHLSHLSHLASQTNSLPVTDEPAVHVSSGDTAEKKIESG